MTTLAELETRWRWCGVEYIAKQYDRREDIGYLVLICAFGGIMTLFDIILVLGS